MILLENLAKALAEKYVDTTDYLAVFAHQSSLHDRMYKAALAGELVCYDSFGENQPRPNDRVIFSTPEAVDSWLARIKSPYRCSDEQPGQPWLIADERDDLAASEDWHIAARYFYRQHKMANPDSLKKHIVPLVLDKLREHKLYKRGGKELPSESAVDKILQNIQI